MQKVILYQQATSKYKRMSSSYFMQYYFEVFNSKNATEMSIDKVEQTHYCALMLSINGVIFSTLQIREPND